MKTIKSVLAYVLIVLFCFGVLFALSCGDSSEFPEIKMVSVEWPDEEVTPLTECIRVNSIEQTANGVWAISLDITKDQYDKWANEMKKNGFIHGTHGFFKEGLLVRTAIMDSYAIGGDYSIRIVIDRNPVTLPEDYAVFPSYTGKGTIFLVETDTMIDEAEVEFEYTLMYVVDADSESIEGYRQTVASSGFTTDDSGNLSKLSGGKTYTYVGTVNPDEQDPDLAPTDILRFEIH